MIKIKNFEDLEPGKNYKAKYVFDSNKILTCRVIKKDSIGQVPGFEVYILENNLDLKPEWKITFPEFKKYIWYELTEN